MSLSRATDSDGAPIPIPGGGPPFQASELVALAGREFRLPPGDPRLPALFDGGPAPTPPLDNLAGACHAWHDHPAYMSYLDPASPNHAAKQAERAIYLDRWEPHLPPGPLRVLDLGGGIGRFTTWFLDRGDEVTLVEPDLRSLWRAVWAAAGRAGRLEAHWTTAERLPPLAGLDVVVAAELFCYCEDPAGVAAAVHAALRPGGLLLASVEARWGWAFAPDAPAGTVEAWLGDGVVHVPGDRWVRTYDEPAFRALLSAFEVLDLAPTHYTWSGAFEAVCEAPTGQEALALEARLRAHPLAGALNRAWTAVARRPGPSPAFG